MCLDLNQSGLASNTCMSTVFLFYKTINTEQPLKQDMHNNSIIIGVIWIKFKYISTND